MIINYEEQHIDLEEEGRCNLVLIGARYTGEKSSVSPDKYNTQAAWPGYTAFQGGPEDPDGQGRKPGPAQGALIPDWTDEETENRTVEALESDPDMDVLYRPEDIARAMLSANYLDPNVFGRGFEADVRDRVFDALGIKDVGVRNEKEYRDQLREIAGIDADEADVQAETRDDSRVTEYRQDHSRSGLIDAAKILGMDADRADGAGKIELATWLADQDREAVRFALEGKADAARDASAGDDVAESEVERWTSSRAADDYEHDELKAVVKSVRQGAGEFSLRGVDDDDMATFLVDTKGLTEAEIDAHLTE